MNVAGNEVSGSWSENILKVGSPRPKLHAEAVTIYTLCRQHSICLEPDWIPQDPLHPVEFFFNPCPLMTKSSYLL